MKNLSESIRNRRGGTTIKSLLQDGDIVCFVGWKPALVLTNQEIIKSLDIYSYMYDFNEGVFLTGKDMSKFMVISDYDDNLEYHSKTFGTRYCVESIWRKPYNFVTKNDLKRQVLMIDYELENNYYKCIWKRK